MPQKLPTVTQVLGVWSDFSHVREEVLRAAADRGTRFHRYVSAKLQGLMLPDVDPDIRGYVESWERWASVCIDAVFLVEFELVDRDLGFRGHPDAIVRIKGDVDLTLIDWKTPQNKLRVWECQLAAYKRLADVDAYPGRIPRRVGRIMSVRPDRDGGRAKTSEYSGNYGEAFAAFVGCLNAWKFFNC